MDHGGVDSNGTTVVLFEWDHGGPVRMQVCVQTHK